jgi:molybdate/tungstate transport system ATP-binding protein
MIEPKILLLDEPLSAIDPSFRGELQTMLKQLHQNSGITFLMVTHDFPEALALAQKAAIISNGTIRQQGDIMDIFRKPCSGFVADFVGMKNIYKARLNDNKAVINGIELELGSKFNKENSYIAIRPEDIILSNKMLSTTSIRNSVKGTVRGIVCNGLSYEVNVSVNSLTFKSIITSGAMIDLGIEEGKEIYASFKATAIHCF